MQTKLTQVSSYLIMYLYKFAELIQKAIIYIASGDLFDEADKRDIFREMADFG